MLRTKNVVLANEDVCTGCGACANVCPTESIVMSEDCEGFLQPRIDENRCVECHMCEKTCPILNKEIVSDNYETKVFAVINTDDDVRIKSSSGGVFHALAKWVIEQGGVVFGARWNDKWEVVHGYAEDLKGVEAFMRSKYVQSRIGETYKQVKKFLKSGRWVLYSGTPCQLGGLRAYLGKEYNKLIQVDLICHGVPSPGVWRDYLNSYYRCENVIDISFRDKVQGWGLGYCLTTTTTTIREDCWNNSYYTGFLSNVLLRKSCFHCVYRKLHRASDITLADYWGVDKVCKEMFDGKGTSAVFVHSLKGHSLINEISNRIRIAEQTREMVIESGHNMTMVENPNMPKRRLYFFKAYKYMPYRMSLRYMSADPYLIRVKRKSIKILHELTNLIKKDS